MTNEIEFTECDTCRAKPGSPDLCEGCLKNRKAIADVNARLVTIDAALDYSLVDLPMPEKVCDGRLWQANMRAWKALRGL